MAQLVLKVSKNLNLQEIKGNPESEKQAELSENKILTYFYQTILDYLLNPRKNDLKNPIQDNKSSI